MSDTVNSLFQDPSNYKEIIEQIKECENHDQVVSLINKTFPEWILGWPKKYSKDFPILTNNWEYVCKKSGTSPLSVIIVETVIFDDSKYTLIKMFSELLTLFGHSVRRKEEFIECTTCGNALPTKTIFLELLERKSTDITSWNTKCIDC
jgi:hypothetical protein